ncbi:hypothetical protein ABT167_28055 [Streptomyces sp. NPDC001792]|uniref:hypothetical protein n=1 Tax=Streptomyces sp. NPDC001792 TaxID=3154524 RepID=UPI0033268D5C
MTAVAVSVVRAVGCDGSSTRALLPTSPGGVPWNDGFSWKYVNYTPLVVGGTLLALRLAWELRMKNRYTGPRSTVDLPAEVPLLRPLAPVRSQAARILGGG